MFKKILVALDNSDLRPVVLEQAIALAKATEARLMMVHVLSAYEEGSPGVPIRSYQAYYPILDDATWKVYQQRWEEFADRGMQQLKRDAEVARQAGVTAEFSQLTGEPGPVLCGLAKTWETDLIMVGSHGRRGLSELLLGSVSNYVMHRAECSVLVVHNHLTSKEKDDSSLAATEA
ncbi:MAG: universal stress protein [Leptolyngbya sp. LCM1.Bin17]|nr:MAG: universal stress protein [Leptolyngbya sp. LCM1.Bin17]